MHLSHNLRRIALTFGCIALLIGCGAVDPDEPAEAPGELLKGQQERDTAPEIDAEAFDQFTADNRDFAFAMFDQLREDEGEEENVFVSPHSITSALAMTYAGADGNTRDEMAAALNYLVGDDDLHPAFNKLDLQLDERTDIETDDDEDLDLEIVNQTWGQKDYPFLEEYLDILSLHYGAGMYAVDFSTEYEQIRQEINAWVEDRTNDLITDLLPEGSLDALTRLVLVNAIYFYGTWQDTFDPDSTRDRPFTRLDGSETDVEMMRHDDATQAGYFGGDETTAVSLPYVGGDLSMIAVKPAEATTEFLGWEQDFDRETFDAVIDGLDTKQGMVNLPKFEDDGEYDLIPPFQAMGMEDAFDAGAADFGRMADLEAVGENLFISGIFHQTFIEVDEEGTEAAAATGVVVGAESAPIIDFEVTFDRPFIYAIYDHGTETILFMGRMLDP